MEARNPSASKSKVLQTLLNKKDSKDLPFQSLQLQIPEQGSPSENEASPTSVVVSPGSKSALGSPKHFSRSRSLFSVLPCYAGDLSDEYILSPVEIGRGRSGIVRECVHKLTGRIMACKSVDKSTMKPKGRRAEALTLEVKLALVLSNHPNVIKFYRIYEDTYNVHFVMEKCEGGDLFDLITSKGRLTEQQSAWMLKKIGEAVAYTHSKGVVHRDIKPENIMINNFTEMEPRLGDFGQAYVICDDDYPFGIAGSPPYMAPEIILGMTYGFGVDVWSLGILLYIMLSGLLPYHGTTTEETFEFILAYEPNLTSPPWDIISSEAKDLVRKMLRRDPNERFSLDQVLSEPWLISNSLA